MREMEFDLFTWWAICISGGSIFLALVSIYLYLGSKAKRQDSFGLKKKKRNLMKDFVFVWVLLGLLIFYIVTIQVGNSLIFALGNIVVEALLIGYLVTQKTTGSD